MTTQSRSDAVYPLGSTEEGYRLLVEQARLVRPSTEQLFVQAGIRRGMWVLDIGCGVGDVSMLAADLVGPKGAVVGVDTDPRALRLARERAAGRWNVTFVEGDLRDVQFDTPFDAAVGRFVLVYLADPVAAIRQVLRQVRPGGIIALQEMHYEFLPPFGGPRMPLYERLMAQAVAMMRRAGGEVQIGLKLHTAFAAAGLPQPELRMDTVLGAGPNFAGYQYLATVFRSLLPMMERFEIATAAELDVDTLAERLRAEVAASDGVLALPPLFGAWVHTRGGIDGAESLGTP